MNPTCPVHYSQQIPLPINGTHNCPSIMLGRGCEAIVEIDKALQKISEEIEKINNTNTSLFSDNHPSKTYTNQALESVKTTHVAMKQLSTIYQQQTSYYHWEEKVGLFENKASTTNFPQYEKEYCEIRQQIGILFNMCYQNKFVAVENFSKLLTRLDQLYYKKKEESYQELERQVIELEKNEPPLDLINFQIKQQNLVDKINNNQSANYTFHNLLNRLNNLQNSRIEHLGTTLQQKINLFDEDSTLDLLNIYFKYNCLYTEIEKYSKLNNLYFNQLFTGLLNQLSKFYCTKAESFCSQTENQAKELLKYAPELDLNSFQFEYNRLSQEISKNSRCGIPSISQRLSATASSLFIYYCSRAEQFCQEIELEVEALRQLDSMVFEGQYDALFKKIKNSYYFGTQTQQQRLTTALARLQEMKEEKICLELLKKKFLAHSLNLDVELRPRGT